MVKLGSSLSRRRVNTILKNRADRKAIREAKKNAKWWWEDYKST